MKIKTGDNKRIALILEAAGDARRFGRNKLLETMPDGSPVVSHILETARACEGLFCKKILVTQYDEVAAMAPDFEIVINDRPEIGISHSMQLGIEAAGDADAYMFCVCDQPRLTAASVRSLVDAYIDSGCGIISLSWDGRMFNPKIFSSAYRDELMALSGDTGGRQIISSHRDDLLLVEAGSEEEVRDIDTPEDMK